jgi:hypothetical protein
MIEFRTHKTSDYCCMSMHPLEEAEPYFVIMTFQFDKK